MRILAKEMVDIAQTRYHADRSENLLGVNNSMIEAIIVAWKQLVNSDHVQEKKNHPCAPNSMQGWFYRGNGSDGGRISR
jgi:hypothetical protein